MKNSRPVIAFALLSQCSELLQTDLLGGISILIRPLISDLTGQRFSSEALATRITDTYGMSIAPSVLEEFLPRFKDAGIVDIRAISANVNEAFFNSVDELATDPNDERAFQGVLDEFSEFARIRLQNVGVTIADAKLVEGLLTRLTSLDFLSIQNKPQNLDATSEQKKVLGPSAKQNLELTRQISDDARIDVLVASYVYEIVALDPSRLNLVSRVADGALGAELVFDLQAPKQIANLSNVTVVLDTPLVLALLDLSSKQAQEYTEKFVNSVKASGAKLAVYRHSIEEAEGVLLAVKNGVLCGNAYGPTAERMRTTPYRIFFETMLGRVGSRIVSQHEFEILAPCANHYYQHFTSKDEECLTSNVHFSILDKRIARERDAQSVAETIRRRGGSHIPVHQISASKFIFITSNSSLQLQARKHLMATGNLAKDEFAPVVTDRYFAGILWLLFGGKSGAGLSTARLLANCANALKMRQDVVQRTKRFLSSLDPIKAQHFEVLMTNERAAQFMTEISLGDSLLVTQENAENLYEQLEAIAGEKVARQKDEQYGNQINGIKIELDTTTENLNKTTQALHQANLDRDASREEMSSLSGNLVNVQAAVSAQKDLLQIQTKRNSDLEDALESERLIRVANEESIKAMKARQVDAARRKGRKQVTIYRVGVMVVVLLLAGTANYVDKFVTPNLDKDAQTIANFLFVISQVVMSAFGLGLLVEVFSGWILKSAKATAFKNHLKEMGWDEESIEIAFDNEVG